MRPPALALLVSLVSAATWAQAGGQDALSRYDDPRVHQMHQSIKALGELTGMARRCGWDPQKGRSAALGIVRKVSEYPQIEAAFIRSFNEALQTGEKNRSRCGKQHDRYLKMSRSPDLLSGY